jgi:hypothetical protein
MKVAFVSAAALALAAGASFADRIDTAHTSALPGFRGDAGAGRAGTINTGFEAGEGYAVGPINGQQGWASLGNVFAGLGNGSAVQNVLPFAGTQHMASVKDPAVASGTFNGAWHDAGGAGITTTSAKVYISQAAYADYFFAGLDTAGQFAWEVHFSFTGTVFNGGTGTALAPIVYGQYVDLVSTYDAATGNVTVNYNGAQVYNGTSGFTATNLVYDKVAWLSDNFNTGGGDPNEHGLVDNLVAVPAPGSAALLAMAGLVARRRRR